MLYAKIPVAELVKLENARIDLFELMEKTGFFESYMFATADIMTISKPMWSVANIRWELIE